MDTKLDQALILLNIIAKQGAVGRSNSVEAPDPS